MLVEFFVNIVDLERILVYNLRKITICEVNVYERLRALSAKLRGG